MNLVLKKHVRTIKCAKLLYMAQVECRIILGCSRSLSLSLLREEVSCMKKSDSVLLLLSVIGYGWHKRDGEHNSGYV